MAHFAAASVSGSSIYDLLSNLTGSQLQWAVAAVVLLLVLALILAASLRRERLPYSSREVLLSQGELAFYRVLVRALPEHLGIAPKVRLADVLRCSADGWKRGYFGKIAQKHLDFVIIQQSSARLLMAIELDDRSHERRDRRERDAFVDRAMATAGLPLLHVPAANSYDGAALRQTVKLLLRKTRLDELEPALVR